MIIDPDMPDHWKTRMLVDLLGGDELAPLYLIRLWGHCQNRKKYEFDALPPVAVKAICRFPGDADDLNDALSECGFIERDGKALLIVGWAEHNSALVKNWVNGKQGGRPPKSGKKETQEEPRNNPTETQEEPNENPAGTVSGFGVTDREDREDREDNKPQTAGAVRDVFDHWVTAMGKDPARTKLTADRKNKIAARLKDYPLDDLLAAIDGCAGSSFHMGDNPDGKRHDAIELIFRNGEKLEIFRDMRPARLTAVPAPAPKTGNEINPFGRF